MKNEQQEQQEHQEQQEQQEQQESTTGGESWQEIVNVLRDELKARDARIDKLIEQSQKLANSHGNYVQPGIQKHEQKPNEHEEYKTLAELDYSM